jgi:hypothetical protein
MKNLRIIGVTAEIWTGHLLNTTHRPYRLSELAREGRPCEPLPDSAKQSHLSGLPVTCDAYCIRQSETGWTTFKRGYVVKQTQSRQQTWQPLCCVVQISAIGIKHVSILMH